MAWLIGIGTGLVSAAIWAAVALLIEYRRHRSGPLAGDWYQVTFDPNVADKIWSIEFLEVKHLRDKVFGNMWRIYPAHYDRQWTFSGLFRYHFLRAQYACTRGDGRDGMMKLAPYSRSNCAGRFEEDQPTSVEFGATFAEFKAPLEWIKVGCDQEPAVIDRLEEAPQWQYSEYLPRRVLRKLTKRAERMTGGDRVLRALSYCGALNDLSSPLAMQAMQIRDAQQRRWEAVQRAHEREQLTEDG
jgi:hypothetical protein